MATIRFLLMLLEHKNRLLLSSHHSHLDLHICGLVVSSGAQFCGVVRVVVRGGVITIYNLR